MNFGQLFGQGGGMAAQPGADAQVVDNAEMVYISSLALLKMLKHGRFQQLRLERPKNTAH
jgi:26S proteasome regulatory subunit N11